MHASRGSHSSSNCVRSLLSNSYKRGIVHPSMHTNLEICANINCIRSVLSNSSRLVAIQECPSIHACFPGDEIYQQLHGNGIVQLLHTHGQRQTKIYPCMLLWRHPSTLIACFLVSNSECLGKLKHDQHFLYSRE